MSDTQPLRDIRPSPIAGRWYPGDAGQLAASVDAYIDAAGSSAIQGRLVGLLAPHAGHRYSGPVAGYAFTAIRDLDVDVVALVGPSHYDYPARVVTTAHDAYQTPLGTLPVDHTALDALRQTVPIDSVRKDPEHAIEIELPFLQRMLDSFRVIPLALIDQSLALAEALGLALADVLRGRDALLVASSDLSHFYPQPLAEKFDQAVLDAVGRYDPAGVIQAEERGQGFACGRGAIATVMIAAEALGADTAQIIKYATSGDVTRDYGQVVGYGAALFYASTSV